MILNKPYRKQEINLIGAVMALVLTLLFCAYRIETKLDEIESKHIYIYGNHADCIRDKVDGLKECYKNLNDEQLFDE